MKIIRFNENIRFNRCRAKGYQVCSYCGKHIGKGNVGLVIAKKTSNPLNVWIHTECIEKFAEGIIKFKEDNLKGLLLANLNTR